MNESRRGDPAWPDVPFRKRFGQHHLIRGSICRPLLDYLRPHGCLVIEIGPGGGVLTRELVAAGGKVVAVEIDLAWAAELPKDPGGSVSVWVGDATQMHWPRVPPGTLVTGNLPFNVGTVLIEQLLSHWRRIPRAAFLLQKEVADRLVASRGDAAYGALSVLTQARARVTRLGRVGRGSFRPPPKVDGAFVGLELQEPALGDAAMAGLVSTVRLAFSQRRKQLRNALAAEWGRQETLAILREARIDPRCRAQELSLDQFLRLHEARARVVTPARRT